MENALENEHKRAPDNESFMPSLKPLISIQIRNAL